MDEKGFWNRIRGPLAQYGDFERVENAVSGGGTPDVDFCVAGIAGKIELKYIPSYPVRASTRVMGDRGLRKEQVVWIHRRIRHGGRCFILVGVEQDFWLFRPDYTELFDMNQWSITEFGQQAVFLHRGGRVAPLWPEFIDVLTRIGK